MFSFDKLESHKLKAGETRRQREWSERNVSRNNHSNANENARIRIRLFHNRNGPVRWKLKHTTKFMLIIIISHRGMEARADRHHPTAVRTSFSRTIAVS